jgi:hypothetical protein
MDKEEIKKLLGIILASYQNNFSVKLETISTWYALFKDQNSKDVFEAAKQAILGCSFPPTPSDIMKVIKERERLSLPEALTWSPEEALSNSHSSKVIIQASCEFANRVAPPIEGHRQFDSEEEMQRAVDIRAREWDRAFKNRFQSYKDKILALHKQGVNLKLAGETVLYEDKINLPELIGITKELCNLPENKALPDR